MSASNSLLGSAPKLKFTQKCIVILLICLLIVLSPLILEILAPAMIINHEPFKVHVMREMLLKVQVVREIWYNFHTIAAILLLLALILQLMVLARHSEPKRVRLLGTLVALMISLNIPSSLMILRLLRVSGLIYPAEFASFPIAALGFQLLMLYKYSSPKLVRWFGFLSLVVIFMSMGMTAPIIDMVPPSEPIPYLALLLDPYQASLRMWHSARLFLAICICSGTLAISIPSYLIRREFSSHPRSLLKSAGCGFLGNGALLGLICSGLGYIYGIELLGASRIYDAVSMFAASETPPLIAGISMTMIASFLGLCMLHLSCMSFFLSRELFRWGIRHIFGSAGLDGILARCAGISAALGVILGFSYPCLATLIYII